MLEKLTQAERRVVALVARGLTNREIADELRLRPKTIEWTLTNIYRKLALRSRTELAVEAVHPDRLGDRQTAATPVPSRLSAGAVATDRAVRIPGEAEPAAANSRTSGRRRT